MLVNNANGMLTVLMICGETAELIEAMSEEKCGLPAVVLTTIRASLAPLAKVPLRIAAEEMSPPLIANELPECDVIVPVSQTDTAGKANPTAITEAWAPLYDAGDAVAFLIESRESDVVLLRERMRAEIPGYSDRAEAEVGNGIVKNAPLPNSAG